MSEEGTPAKKTRQEEAKDAPASEESLGPSPDEIAELVRKAQENAKKQIQKAKEDINAYKKKAAVEEAENPSKKKSEKGKRIAEVSLEDLKDGKTTASKDSKPDEAEDDSMADDASQRKIFKAGGRFVDDGEEKKEESSATFSKDETMTEVFDGTSKVAEEPSSSAAALATPKKDVAASASGVPVSTPPANGAATAA